MPNMWNTVHVVEGDASSKDKNRVRYTHGTRLPDMIKNKLDNLEATKKRVQAGKKTVAEWEQEIQGDDSRSAFFKAYDQSRIRAKNVARVARADLNNEEMQSCLCMRRGSSPLDDVGWPARYDVLLHILSS
jgi:uncharacterized protein YicC (UPF0701 family)